MKRLKFVIPMIGVVAILLLSGCMPSTTQQKAATPRTTMAPQPKPIQPTQQTLPPGQCVSYHITVPTGGILWAPTEREVIDKCKHHYSGFYKGEYPTDAVREEVCKGRVRCIR